MAYITKLKGILLGKLIFFSASQKDYSAYFIIQNFWKVLKMMKVKKKHSFFG
jgi:hypothetical protein